MESLNEWLNHPAVQGGIVPFIAALIATELLNRLRLSGLAVIAGFYVSYALPDMGDDLRLTIEAEAYKD